LANNDKKKRRISDGALYFQRILLTTWIEGIGEERAMRQRRRSEHRQVPRAVAATALAIALTMPEAVAQSGLSAPLQLTVNHAEAITLQADPAVALIANPDIADIVSEKNNLVFVIGRKPGATNLLVYDNSGQRLMNREIVVVPDAGKEVTITRDTDVVHYYCEPDCVFLEHEESGTAPNVAPTPVAASGGSGPVTAQAPAGVTAAPPSAPGTSTGGAALAAPGH
jgi:Pilus formation protein N terminal region